MTSSRLHRDCSALPAPAYLHLASTTPYLPPLPWKGPTSLWSSCLHSLSIMVEVAHHGEIVRDVTVPLMTRQTHASSQPLHSKSTNTTSVEPKMRTSAIRTNALPHSHQYSHCWCCAGKFETSCNLCTIIGTIAASWKHGR